VGQFKNNTGVIYEHGRAAFFDGSYLYSSTGNTISVRRGGSLHSGKDNSYGSSWGQLEPDPNIICQHYGQTGTHLGHRLFVRNLNERMGNTANTDNPGVASTSKYLYVGARADAQPVVTPTLHWSGSIAAMALYTPALRVDQVFKVMRYFGNKFNVGM